MNDVFNRRIGFVIGSFEGAVELRVGIGPMMEQAVGERPAEALMEEQEEKRRAEAFVGEAIRIAAAVAFEKTVRPEFAQVVPKLVEPVLLGGEAEPGHDGVMEVRGPPACDEGAPIQEHFHEADHPGVVNLDAGHLGGADLNRARQALE